MMQQPPALFISVGLPDTPFARDLARRLQSRGLMVQLSIDIPPGHTSREFLSRFTLFFTVTSATSATSATLRGEWEQALAQGTRIIPIVLHRKTDVAPELQRLQWIDFSESVEAGWLDLLALLDTLNFARFPQPSTPFLDWELALARAYRGRLPYSWRSYRIASSYYLILSDGAIGAVLISLSFLLCFMSSIPAQFSRNYLLGVPQLAQIILFLGLCGVGLRAIYPSLLKARSYTKQANDFSEIVIITPEGFGVRIQHTDHVFQFREVAAIALLPDQIDAVVASVNLRQSVARQNVSERLNEARHRFGVTLHDGRSIALSLGSRFPWPDSILQDITAAYQNYRQRQSAPTSPASNDAGSRVFLSHARLDRAGVDRLDMALQQCGLQTWVDRSMLTGGQEWSEELRRAIAQCSALIVCLSPRALKSRPVQQEYEYALQLGKPVIAIRLYRGGRIPPALRGLIHSDFTRGVDRSPRTGLAPLLIALMNAGVAYPKANNFEVMPVLTRVLAPGSLPVNWHVYQGRPPLFRMVTWITGLAIITPIILALLAFQSGSGLLIAIAAASFALTIGWMARMSIRTPLLEPPMIITTPEAFFILAFGRATQSHYANYQSVTLTGPRGTLWIQPSKTGKKLPIRVLGVFLQGRRIKRQIISDFQQYQQQAVRVGAYESA